jgi:tetratricopeptide (TPR) repeat protein
MGRRLTIKAVVFLILLSVVPGFTNGQDSGDRSKVLEEVKALRSELDRQLGENNFSQAFVLRRRIQALVDQEVVPLKRQAATLTRDGDYQGALVLLNQGLKLSEEALGSNDPNLIPLLSDLIVGYGLAGEFHLADALLKQLEALLNEHSPMLLMQGRGPQLAVVLYNIAIQYRDRGEYVRAETLYRQSLNIRERIAGPDSPTVATVLHSLGLLSLNRGEPKQALPLFQRALAIIEKALQFRDSLSQMLAVRANDSETERSLNFDLISALNGLALIHEAEGETSEADKLLQRAILVSQKAFGEQSAVLAGTLNNAAVCYKSRGQYDEAEKLLLRVILMKEKLLGRLHPSTGESLGNLALVYLAKGQISQALEYFKLTEEVGERNRLLVLSVGSERQKHLFMNTRSGEVDTLVSMQARVAPDNPVVG